MNFAFTSCVAEGGKLAVKKFFKRADGSLREDPYDRITWWNFRPGEVNTLAQTAALLRGLAVDHPDVMIVMGAPKPGLDLSRAYRRRWANAEGNNLVDVARAWLPVDADDYVVPAPFGLAEHLADAAAAIRDDGLGEEFADVACVVAATSKTGLVGEELARLRLFFLLDQPHLIADLHSWARGAQLAGLAVDPSVMQVGQPIYTGRPKFYGMEDPVPAERRAFVLPGRSGRVTLDLTRHQARAAVVERRIFAATAAAGRDWRKLLDSTLGSETGFFAPLSQGLGLAVRNGAGDDEVQGYVAALLADRADPKRVRQYGPQWVAATLRSFRQRDDDAHRKTLAAYAALFTKEPA